jgi:hypothetical protein
MVLCERPVGGSMGRRDRLGQAMILVLRFAQLVGVVSPVAAGERDMEDSGGGHPV